MNKLCRNALASCLAATFAVGGGIAVPAASGASLEQDTAVAGMAVSLDNYYASSQTPEADIMDYIRYIVASAQEKKIIPVFTVNATTKEDGSVVFGTSLVSKDASEKEEGLVSVMASLNVRNKPSVSSNVIGYLYSNCVVSIYDTVDNSEGSWYLIKSGDVEGYVSSDYVLTGAAAKASDEDLTNRYAKVKANTAVVYSSASSSADSVGSVYKDGDYKVLAIQNGFVKIAVNEEFAGFVKAEDVSLYTRHAEAVAITDQMVKNQLDSYLVDIRDAEAIFEKRMAAADYQAAYSVDVDGNALYTDDMSDDEKFAAATQAALGFFEAAGYTVEDGKVTAAPEGAKMSYEIIIGADGNGDHPSFAILTDAKAALESIGFTLEINDVTDSNIMWDALNAGTAEMWAAAWQATVDPDMYQVYHSASVKSNYYHINDETLDQDIIDARSTADQEYRKSVYKQCLDIILDWAVEIPIYQRQNCVIYSPERINADTFTKDVSTFYYWYKDIENIEMN